MRNTNEMRNGAPGRSPWSAILVAVSLAGLVGCGGSGGSSSTPDPTSTECTTCHATTTLSTGAHQAHLQGGAFAGATACEECHVVPTNSNHATQPVAITFGTLAKTGGLNPAYDATTKTCSNVYCHGAGSDGRTGTTPAWDSTAALDCGSCHADPPSLNGFHPTATTGCASCHPDTVDAAGAVLVAGGKHVDGPVEYQGSIHPAGWQPVGHMADIDFSTCLACHPGGRSCNDCH